MIAFLTPGWPASCGPARQTEPTQTPPPGDELTHTEGPAAAFARRITRESRLKGWSNVELAKRSGVGRNTLSLMSKGVRLPHARTVVALAKAVDLDLDEAFKLAGYDETPDVITDVAPEQEAEQETRSTMADALRRRLPGLDDATLARVAMAMADVLQGAANELFEASEEDA